MTFFEAFMLLGGIGLFLYGMTMMSTGLKNACGENLRVILERATRNKLMAVGAGIGVTVLVQSSSATDVMVIGFVTSGLMTLSQAIGVIMGANIGTTVTAQITAFDIGKYSPLILFVGTVMFLFIKHKTVKHIGSVIMGFGMLFLGITLMKQTIAPLAETAGFKSFMSTLSNPVLAVVVGILFTALLQSSSSAVVIFQAFAIQGLISYNVAVYLIIGAAIGSVTPNLLAGLTANRNGKRCAILNLLFNLVRAVLILTLISIFPQILTFIQSLSPDNVGRQIANTHTIFAVAAVMIILPFSNLLVKLAEKIIPMRDAEKADAEAQKLIYLTQTDKVPPAVAIDQAHREIARMGHIAIDNLRNSIDCFFDPQDEKIERVKNTESAVDQLTRAIMDKLVVLHAQSLDQKEQRRLYKMISAVNDFERISDHAENISEYAEQQRSGKAKLGAAALDDVRELADASLESVIYCLNLFENVDSGTLSEAEDLEEHVDDVRDKIIDNHVTRLMNGTCDPQGGVIFTDIATDLERCSDHAINIAAVFSDAA